MTSPRQRLANRRNALHASGPKTASGKRRAAANSTQHGLTLPIELTHWADQLSALTELLVMEGFSRPEAWQRARCILDYERNVQYQQERFLLAKAGKRPEIIHSEYGEEHRQIVSFLDRALEDRTGHCFGFGRPAARIFSKFFKRVVKGQERELRRQEERVFRSADRYLRRAANQLIRQCRSE